VIEIVFADFEFSQDDLDRKTGRRPSPWCVSWCTLTDRTLRSLWLADGAPPKPPYRTDVPLCAYYAPAEIQCHLVLGWEVPPVLDLFTEHRLRTNGEDYGWSLIAAMHYFGLEATEPGDKDHWRNVAIRGVPFTDDERVGLMRYCESDVEMLVRLFDAMERF
jgi:DNA polymerase-1